MHAYHLNAKKLSYWMGVLLSLTLVACNSSPATETTGNTAESPTAAPVSAAAGSCPVGKWQITDFTSYFDSVGSGIAAKSNSDITITNKGVSGNAWFTFNPDGTAEISGDNFTQNFALTAAAGGLDIPASVEINGASQANYSLSGDQITFTDQKAGDMKILVTIMGSTTNTTDAFLGKADTPVSYSYTCPDASTLTLKVATSTMDLAPITLTRVP